MINHRPVLTVLVSSLLVAGITATADDVPDAWRTVAEVSDFEATSSYDETMDFLRRVDDASAGIHLGFFGRSGAGRLLPLVVVSSDGAFTPEEATATGKPILLLQSCIHAGEVDGKDASLIMLRDMVLGRLPIPKHTIVLVAPIFNADGHERVSVYNRANQNGPTEGMGFRTTANGINLNRDHMRAVTIEMRGLLDVVNRWRPHLHVDNHVTNGSDHGWMLTWMVAEEPALSPPLDRWLAKTLPAVLDATAEAGHPNGPYVDLRDPTNPSLGFTWLWTSPRLSTDYFPLRNRPSILIEMHAHKPFRDRVQANRDFLVALIESVDKNPAALVAAVVEAEAITVRRGGPDAEPSDIVLRWRPSGAFEEVTWPAARWTVSPSTVTGEPQLYFDEGFFEDIRVRWYHGQQPELVVPRPRGYLVLPGWPQIERLLTDHGLVARRLPEALNLEVESIRVSDPVLGEAPYQGTTMVEDFVVSRLTVRRTVPAGAVWVPANQPDFEVAVQLFEPEAPDSMLRWGLLNTVFEHKEYIGSQQLAEMADEMLADEDVRVAWETALADEAFAADARARYLWWYRRTPYWDEEVGLLPVFRVMELPTLPAINDQ